MAAAIVSRFIEISIGGLMGEVSVTGVANSMHFSRKFRRRASAAQSSSPTPAREPFNPASEFVNVKACDGLLHYTHSNFDSHNTNVRAKAIGIQTLMIP